MGWNDIEIKDTNKTPKLQDLVEVHTYKDAEFHAFRAVSDTVFYAQHWFECRLPKGKKGKNGKTTNNFPKLCLNVNPKTGAMEDHGCPYCKLQSDPPSIRILGNFIDREEQENRPAHPKPYTPKEKKVYKISATRKARFKDKKSKSWTPVHVLSCPPSLGRKIHAISQMNKKNPKTGQAYDIGDIHHGMDICIRYDDSAKGSDMYQVNKGKYSPLTPEEYRYPIWRLDVMKPESLAEAKREAARIAKILVRKDDDHGLSAGDDDDAFSSDDMEGEDMTAKRRRKPAKSRAAADDFGDDIDDDDFSDEDSGGDFSDDDFSDNESGEDSPDDFGEDDDEDGGYRPRRRSMKKKAVHAAPARHRRPAAHSGPKKKKRPVHHRPVSDDDFSEFD